MNKEEGKQGHQWQSTSSIF